jgi:hypothetical protein
MQRFQTSHEKKNIDKSARVARLEEIKKFYNNNPRLLTYIEEVQKNYGDDMGFPPQNLPSKPGVSYPEWIRNGSGLIGEFWNIAPNGLTSGIYYSVVLYSRLPIPFVLDLNIGKTNTGNEFSIDFGTDDEEITTREDLDSGALSIIEGYNPYSTRGSFSILYNQVGSTQTRVQEVLTDGGVGQIIHSLDNAITIPNVSEFNIRVALMSDMSVHVSVNGGVDVVIARAHRVPVRTMSIGLDGVRSINIRQNV